MSQDDTTPPKSPMETVIEHAIETLLYAPIGLIFERESVLPQLIEKGRNQVTMARMLGKFAVEQGRGEATKAAGRLQDQAAGLLDFIGGGVTPMPADPAPAPSRAPRRAPRTSARAAGVAQQAARNTAGAPSSSAHPGADHLAIPDYDGLSASHVVNRLAGLSAPELEAVREYEAANRGRKTILSKVAQLQSS
ncbi:MAG: hypothetical protein ACT4OV_10620 [Microthrixaceae bacterium]